LDRNCAIFITSVLLGSLMVVTSVTSYMWVPAYDPVTFLDDFSGSAIDSSLWLFVGSVQKTNSAQGRIHLGRSIVTLESDTHGVAFLSHTYATRWPSGVEYGAWRGDIEFLTRFNGFSEGSSSVIIARTDGGWVGIVDHQFTYFDEEPTSARSMYVLGARVDSDWHTFKISFSNDGRKVYWDGNLAVKLTTVTKFTKILLGHTDPGPRSGGSMSFDWFRSCAMH